MSMTNNRIKETTIDTLHISKLAECYRYLADWMETHETLPWHVGVNWSKDGLIVHLHEQSFARIFADKNVDMTCDGQGTTWIFEHNHILFTCYVPNASSLISAFGRSNSKKSA